MRSPARAPAVPSAVMADRKAVPIVLASGSVRSALPVPGPSGHSGRLNGAARAPAGDEADGASAGSSGPPRRRGPTIVSRGLAAATAIGGSITLALALVPGLQFAYRSPAAHVAIDTGAGVIAALAAILTFERFRRTASQSDLLLVAAVAVFAVTNLLLSVAPAVSGAAGDPGSAWGLLGARLTGAALFAAAAFARPRPLRAPDRALTRIIGACACVLAAMALLSTVFASALPPAIDQTLSPKSLDRPLLIGHPGILAGQVLAMALFAAGAVGFARRTTRAHDELLWWLALGSILAAFARLNYLLFPSLYTEFVYTGDFFRLAFYAALFLGAAREIYAYQGQLADLAVLDERRRIARDLHDGPAQDLAFIVAQSRAMAGHDGASRQVQHLARAAERALDESRAAIAVLSSPLDEPLATTLRRAAEHVAERHGACVRVSVQGDVDLAPATREGLARIVREATSNAVRHGDARQVAVSLSSGSELRLRVTDDGAGFDPEALRPRADAGFGLISMRERTEALGGELRVRSGPGAGAEIEAVIPWADP